MSSMEKGLRSPLISVFMLILLGYLFTLSIYPDEMPRWISALGVVPCIIVIAVWLIVMIYHNIKYPQRRIPFFSYLPLDLQEEDEGMKWVTMQACRKLYIFMWWAVPIAMAVVAIFRDVAILPIAVIMLLGIIPCLIYWVELRNWRRKSQL